MKMYKITKTTHWNCKGNIRHYIKYMKSDSIEKVIKHFGTENILKVEVFIIHSNGVNKFLKDLSGLKTNLLFTTFFSISGNKSESGIILFKTSLNLLLLSTIPKFNELLIK